MKADAARDDEAAFLRIGELSRRTGVGIHALRAWERRYGVLDPVRSTGGYRLYTPADVERVRAMRSLIGQGVAAAQAASTIRRQGAAVAATAEASPAALAEELYATLAGLDEGGAHAVIDRALASYSLNTLTQQVILPTLREIGDQWEDGGLAVDQEHFATHVVRGRLLGLARGWTGGSGPLALLACPEGEQHDLGLIVFGLTLRANGWRIVLLGADTPADVLAGAADRIRPDLIVVSAIDPERFQAAADGLSRLAAHWPVVLGGAGATDALARSVGAAPLTGDPVASATAVSAEVSNPG